MLNDELLDSRVLMCRCNLIDTFSGELHLVVGTLDDGQHCFIDGSDHSSLRFRVLPS